MRRHFSDDILGDDSLSDFRQFMKINKKYTQKKNYIYIHGLIMVINSYKPHPPPTKY